MQVQDNLLNLVETFQERVNCHNIDGIMSMFTEDATFEIVGLSQFSGKQNLRNIFEYDVGVNTKLEIKNCKVEGDTAHCHLLERNDRLEAIGLNELKYAACSFVFKDGLIQSFKAEHFPEIVKYNSAVWRQFVKWLTKHYPDRYSKMFTLEGRFIYNRENGSGVVPLLRRWCEEHKQELSLPSLKQPPNNQDQEQNPATYL
jgi:hypothetical protein